MTGVTKDGETVTLKGDYLLDYENAHLKITFPGNVNETELVASLINQRSDLISGIKYAQEAIEGSVTLLILTEDDAIIAARDRLGRLPVLIGKDEEGYAVSFESFAYQKLGYEKDYELGPGEIVKITPEGYKTLQPAGEDMKICAFLWSYYGYPNSNYEGVNVEVMRYKNGEIMARDEPAFCSTLLQSTLGALPLNHSSI